tara:strand:- start:957 stop:1373 length:417 start_codon:yes stop_codon:yes gene_type:complete
MTAIILDCSVAVTWCFEDEASAATDRMLDLVQSDGAFVPSHWIMEVSNTLLAGERRKRVTASEIDEFHRLLQNLNVAVDTRTWDEALGATLLLARKHSLTSYDAAYLALAIRLSLPLATKDKALRQASTAENIALIDV